MRNEDPAEAASRDWLADVCELLLLAGFRRARIESLPPFDKVVGGLAWAISASSVEADVEVLWEDDASLGQKLRVAEALENALRRLGCPAPLRAHQITGLDYPALFPVVQWLVKRVLAAREEFGDRLRSFALHAYAAASLPLLPQPAGAISALRQRFPPARVLRRAPGAPGPRDRQAATRWTLVEYGFAFPTSAAAAARVRQGGAAAQPEAARAVASGRDLAEDGDDAEEAAAAMAAVGSADGALSKSAAQRLFALRGAELTAAAAAAAARAAADPTGELARAAALERQRAAAARALAVEEGRLAAACAAAEASEAEAAAASADHESAAQHIERCTREGLALDEAAAQAAGAKAVASATAKILGALRAAADAKAEEAAFKARCRRELAALQQAASEEAVPAEEAAWLVQVAETHAADAARLAALRAAAGRAALGCAALQRRLAERPGRPELAIYERRFVELADAIAAKLAATKRGYAAYNATAEALRLAQAETTLLNQVREQFAAASGSGPEALAAFAAQLATVASGVAEKAARAKERASREQAALAAVTAECAAQRELERQYFAAVQRLQEACKLNAALQRQPEV